MFGFRTPAKQNSRKESTPDSEKAGPSHSEVRRSIDEREAGKTEPSKGSPTRAKPTPPTASQPPQTSKSETRSKSSEAVPSMAAKPEAKHPNLVAEARACLNRAKLHLGNSRNLKTEIKAEVLGAITRLYELVKEAAQSREPAPDRPDTVAERPRTPAKPTLVALEGKLEEHSALLKANTDAVERLKESLIKAEERVTQPSRDSTHSCGHTYAEAASRPTRAATAMHSVVVASANDQDTSEAVLEKIRTVVDAKSTGIKVDRVRKAKDQKVVISCNTRAELAKVTDKLRSPRAKLLVEERRNKDPQVVCRYLLAYNSDEEIIAALKKQNNHLFGGLSPDEWRAQVRYRRKVRNPHECHVVLSVSPQVWQRLTDAGHVHIDLQRVQVLDQSPLVQCARCLGYGHTRRFCEATEDVCSHCAGPHLRESCDKYKSGEQPNCVNCTGAKLEPVHHSAFDQECPVRRRWEAIARTSVQYHC